MRDDEARPTAVGRRSIVTTVGAAFAGAGGLATLGTAGAQPDPDLVSGTTVQGEMTGPQDTAQYTFDASQGDRVLLEITRTGGEGEIGFGVVSPIGRVWASENVGPDQSVPIQGVIEDSGRYVVVVTSFTAAWPGESHEGTGPYTITYVNESEPQAMGE